MMGGGYISMTALKKAPPERIKELLRITRSTTEVIRYQHQMD
jgi:hypothetical protein